MTTLVPDSVADCNTKSVSSSSQPNPCKHWFFTWNNYPSDWQSQVCQIFDDLAKSYAMQQEVGKSGTHHIQGVVSLNERNRPTAFGLPKQIHWEKVKDVKKAYEYCTKEDTRLPNSVPVLKNYTIPKKPKPLKLITPDKWWQQELLELIETEPDDRKVHWYWSHAGSIGKSQFAKYMVAMKNCLFFEERKKADIMHLIFEAPEDRLERIIIDVPRDNGNNVSYKAIESIKNGMIYSPKYEGGYKLFNSPHIIVFANEPPQEHRLSADRWVIKQIDENMDDGNIIEEV